VHSKENQFLTAGCAFVLFIHFLELLNFLIDKFRQKK